MNNTNSKTALDRIVIILVNPEDSGNIGAVCRSMKTMGLKNLYIVKSKKLKKPHDENKIRYTAIHAYDIYENRREYSSLEDAVVDFTIVAAATRRKGKKRKYRTFSPLEMTDIVFSDGCKPAVVFGNEEKGLTDLELKACSAAVEIPSSPDFPSLNLSHAVQIMAYTLFCRFNEIQISEKSNDNQPPEPIRQMPVSIKEINLLSESITSFLGSMGFFKITDDEDIRIFLKDIFSRALINSYEKEKIYKLFNKISGIAGAGKRD